MALAETTIPFVALAVAVVAAGAVGAERTALDEHDAASDRVERARPASMLEPARLKGRRITRTYARGGIALVGRIVIPSEARDLLVFPHL
jgi:hypothetical protein